MEIETKIEQEITPSLMDMGYEVVRVCLTGSDIKTVQVMIERQDRRGMTLKDCTDVSRTVSALLDVMDPFNGRWTLEVSSPGIDRPLLKPADYERFLGHEAKIETERDLNGRKRFKGRLLRLNEAKTGVIIFADEAEVEILFDNIHKAKLILTDDILNKQPKKH
ncbi:MAG: ribosome maturation factor RimP [Alphaproteobacteria bacterium]